MEDIAEALKYAGAVLIFVLALTLTFMLFSQAKATSDIIFYLNDETNFQEMIDRDDGLNGGRLVGVETIIPTLYRYYKENFIVKIINSNGSGIETFDSEMEAKIHDGYDKNGVHYKPEPAKAPWVGSVSDIKKRVDLFIHGANSNINGYPVNYTGKGLLEKYANAKFTENFKISSTSNLTGVTEEGEIIDIQKSSKKIEITYTLIAN